LAHERKLISRGKGVRSQLLDDTDKMLLPTLHIKFGLMKHFVKTLKKQGKCFENLREIFPKFNIAALKESYFIGPQNREIIHDDLFGHLLTNTEKSAWLKFRGVFV